MPDLSPSTAIISAMITPALLILGSGSLVSTALIRLGRIVDRARELSVITEEECARLRIDRPQVSKWLNVYKRRANLAELSVRSFFVGVSLFVADCLSIAVDTFFQGKIPWLPVSITILGMMFMLFGAFSMVSETRLATQQVHDEIAEA